MKPLVRSLAVLILATAGGLPAAAVSLGQRDTFEDGTVQNWVVALLGAVHPAPPVNVPTGGPAGTDDNYLLLTALGGSGPGSRLAAINLAQWAGNYVAAGVTAIQFDLYNFGSDDLSLRLLFADPGAGPPENIALSADPIVLPAGSGWTRVEFPVTLADLVPALNSAEAALTGATELRIFHSVDAVFPGEPVNAQLGVDNITAVPEPAWAAIPAGCGLLSWALVRARWRRR